MGSLEDLLRELAPELYEGNVELYDPLAEELDVRDYDFEDEWEGD